MNGYRQYIRQQLKIKQQEGCRRLSGRKDSRVHGEGLHQETEISTQVREQFMWIIRLHNTNVELPA